MQIGLGSCSKDAQDLRKHIQKHNSSGAADGVADDES
jgi:hypothetical protein